jgi:type II secretory ATPase GspE/PulE/Tfp pilus assembly ATPase PilB-like protein
MRQPTQKLKARLIKEKKDFDLETANGEYAERFKAGDALARTMWHDGIIKAIQGLTTTDEVDAATSTLDNDLV